MSEEEKEIFWKTIVHIKKSISDTWKFNNHSDSANSRRLFRFSLLHLPLLMMLILSSKKYWTNMEKKEENVSLYETAKKSGLLTIFTSTASTISSV